MDLVLLGESIKIFVEIENHSSRKVVPKAAIVKKTIFHAKTKKKTLSEVVIKTKGEPVLAGQKDSRNSMMLEIPELIPTLMNCTIIQMDYSIQVNNFELQFRVGTMGNMDTATKSVVMASIHKWNSLVTA